MPTNPRYQITRIITPATDLTLVSLDQAKAVLGIDPADTSHDAALAQYIAAVSAAVENYCGRTFARQTYRDQFRYVCNWLGPGQALMTRQWPIPVDVDGPVLTVAEDGAAIDPALLDIEIETGLVYRLESAAAIGSWVGMQIIIDYDAGYDVIPPDVQGAALEWLTARWSAVGRDPALRSETIPDVISQTFSSDAVSTTTTSIPSGVRDWLAPYRRWFV